MKGFLWELPETEEAQEWARLGQTPEVQALMRLIAYQRQMLLEALAIEQDNDMRTWLQGQCAALEEIQAMPQECAASITRAEREETDDDGPGRVREWLRQRIGQFRGV